MDFTKIPRQNFPAAKIPRYKSSIRRKFHVVKIPCRENFPQGKFPAAKIPCGENPHGKKSLEENSCGENSAHWSIHHCLGKFKLGYYICPFQIHRNIETFFFFYWSKCCCVQGTITITGRVRIVKSKQFLKDESPK